MAKTPSRRIPRRSLISLGCLGLTSLGLPSALQSAIESSNVTRAKSVLLLYMDGGPSHIDMFDLKPQAPDQIRGPVSAIHSCIPGISIGEYLPMLSQQMHHVAQIRSVRHEDVPHDQAVY
ncbi:MAG: DUF1501 domain-containing protein, partial [Planctomycetes bacterium]|nr:DUF1501 domain-containing protein [Planctomycetota bacterium]